MCDTCGCGLPGQGQPDGQGVKIIKPGEKAGGGEGHQNHAHPHHHDHAHEDGHSHPHTETIKVQQDVLGANNLVAARNRAFFEEHGILALNLMSSPGSGKTTLLERTIKELSAYRWAVIEGDQQTTLDAERIERAGADAVQVNTGTGCHLDASMVSRALESLTLPPGAILAIENVGNLVCPALFDLGEARRIVIVSTTEGTDKPLKYPTILHDAHLCVINKLDLLPYVDFDLDLFKENCRRVNPRLEFVALSATTGDGLVEWHAWIERACRGQQPEAG